MPNDESDVLSFNNYQSKWFAPFVTCFGFGFLIKPVDFCRNNINNSSTEVTDVHRLFGFRLVVIELDNPKPAFVKIKQSENGTGTSVAGLENWMKISRRKHNIEFLDVLIDEWIILA